jgi:branched-chain amino acid transport system ATP-binding protein
VSDLLAVEELDAYYGESQILFDVELSVAEDEVVGLFGRNGMGKTTLLNSIVNRVDHKTGTVRYRGTDVTNWSPHDIVREGLAYVPEDREIYTALTVRENLELAASRDVSESVVDERIGDVFSRFERLEERKNLHGGSLSGGEQQMLAIGRALMVEPDILLLDEPTEGLAPIIVQEVVEVLEELVNQNRAVLLVEQHINKMLPLIDRGYMIENGRMVVEGDAERLGDKELQEKHLTV